MRALLFNFGGGGYRDPDASDEEEKPLVKENESIAEQTEKTSKPTQPKPKNSLNNKKNEANQVSFFAPSKKSRNLGYRAMARELVRHLR